MQGMKVPNCEGGLGIRKIQDTAKEIDCAKRTFLWKINIDSDNGQGSIP